MRFHIRAIKEVYQKEYSLDAIVRFDSLAILQEFLHDCGILSISTEAYKDAPEKFGDVYGTIHRKDTNYDFVVKDGDLQNTIRTMTYMGLAVYAINSYRSVLDTQEAVAVIKQVTDEVSLIQKTKEKDINAKMKISKATYDDANIDRIQTYITTVLQDADLCIQRYSGDKDGIKKLENHIGELKKMRLSKNAEKLEEIIRKIYSDIESMEELYLSSLPQDPIISGSTVSIPFFVHLYDRRERAKKLRAIGVHVHGIDYLYAHSGRSIITMILALIDGRSTIQKVWQDGLAVFATIIFTINIAIVCATLLAMYTYITQLKPIDSILGYSLVVGGILGLSFQIGEKIRKYYLRHTTTILLISILIFVCLRYITRWFLILY